MNKQENGVVKPWLSNINEQHVRLGRIKMDLDLFFFSSVFCEVLRLGILFEGSLQLGSRYWQTLDAISISLVFCILADFL